MNKYMIDVNNIGKRYRLGQTHGQGFANKFYNYKSLRDILTNNLKNIFKRFIYKNTALPTATKNQDNMVWALKDISFKVAPAEMVGIIGRNGAGKSTLLKIISQITEPTEGMVKICGRTASLLEVGTGFHPELTGRENIYLNGAILGMSKAEIKSKFDTIVEFAGVKKFIDTPVKRYSTGMYVRLAFSVAAHLDVEILLIDEVLAVGDFEFQKKCLGKMDSVTKEGRTILFVSHNLSAVKRFCKRTLLLESGKIVQDGPTEEVVRHYLSSGAQSQGQRDWQDQKSAPGNEAVRVRSVRVKKSSGEVAYDFNIQEPVNIELEFQVLTEGHVLNEMFYFFNEHGVLLFVSINNLIADWNNRKRQKGIYKSRCSIPENFLNEGTIAVTVGVYTFPGICHASVDNAVSFRVHDPGYGGVRGTLARPWPGGSKVAIRPLLRWETEHNPAKPR